nr:MAG TPA: hypothetical protein [Caudoviricetes sp.]
MLMSGTILSILAHYHIIALAHYHIITLAH